MANVIDIADHTWKKLLVKGGKDQYLSILANTSLILRLSEEWRGVIAWDEFREQLVTLKVPPWHPDCAPADLKPGPWVDDDTTRACQWLSQSPLYQINTTPKQLWPALLEIGSHHKIHPVKNWLDPLKWDGVLRIPTWLTTYLGVTDTPYSRLVGRAWLISAVARVYRPGCKVDTMLVLEGRQGIGKGQALQILFGEWFSDSSFDLGNKDRFVNLRGKWCVEFSELDSISRAEQSRVKGFLSSHTDDYRPPYGASSISVKRRCVFAGTTNHTEWALDETGNRRVWPVRATRIDLEALSRDREQLWAEAKETFATDPTWWPTGHEVDLCAEEQSQRVEGDPWLNRISDKLAGYLANSWVSTDELLTSLGIEPCKWGILEARRVGRCAVMCGWRAERRMVSGVRKRGYVRE